MLTNDERLDAACAAYAKHQATYGPATGRDCHRGAVKAAIDAAVPSLVEERDDAVRESVALVAA